jgi:uncharacterized membrane protein YvlD (DUF360 family)
MRFYLKKTVIVIIGLLTAAALVPTFTFGPDYKNFLVATASLLIVTLFIKPLFSLVLIPVNFLTLIGITFSLNTLTVFTMTYFLPGFTINAYRFPGANFEGIIIPPYSFNQIATVLLFAAIITIAQKTLHTIFE